jgi:6,7-dimethyl-8-ribityllumazine synthase
VTIIEGDYSGTGRNFALVAGRFNDFITERLVAGATDTLKRHGVAEHDIHIVHVPGAFEIPMAVKALAAGGRYAGIIALGCVIRGATPHFDYVAGECARGIAEVSRQYDVPVGFGVLTVDTVEQAIERSGTKAGNKGIDAAMSTLEMVNLLNRLQK